MGLMEEGSLERMPDAESQWTTLKSGPLDGAERPGKGRKPGKEAEPVDHFEEWTTSWGGKAGKGPEIGGSA